MRDAPEAEVVWQYIRWHAEYGDVSNEPLLTNPDLTDPHQNDERWRILPRNEGHVQRIRYAFGVAPTPYQWSFGPAPEDLFAEVFSNYRAESGLVTIDEFARYFVRHGHLPGFDDNSTRLVEANVRRLEQHENAPEDFDAIILCRPRPEIPPEAYRVVEGTKRAIAVRVAQLRVARLPQIRCYFGQYE